MHTSHSSPGPRPVRTVVKRRVPGAALAGCIALAAGPACDTFTGTTACTEIGCESGLRLTFDAEPPAGTVIEAEAPGEPPRRVECGLQSSCAHGVFLPGFTPDRVVIRVVTPSGEAAHEVQPTYEAFQPNGPGCPPTCHVAHVQLGLP